MRVTVGMLGLAVAGLCLTATGARAQEQKAPPPATPGPVHHKLAKLAGEYTTVAKFAVKPGDPAQESKGTAKLTSVLGGRFVHEEVNGSLMGQANTSLRL